MPDETTQHSHPDSVIVIQSTKGQVNFIPAQTHIGENIGKTPTRVIIVELEEPKH